MASEPRGYKGEVLDQELANEKNKRFNKSVIRGFKRIPGVTSVGRTSEFPRINLKLKREVTAE
ncbi:MAG: hypothetical protein Q8R15_02800, partial [Candidatus Micrarchaeota archaeon]|nr:hypothetical protein [Candidatus Micrarchaeota archaeon]